MHLQENIPLAPWTTLRIGGPARYFIRIRTEDELLEAIHFARDRKLPSYALGGGSNLVIGDEGFPGVILQLALQPSIARTDHGDHIVSDVSAGVEWDDLVRSVCEQGTSGMECLAGIPGLVGASPIQNIGAYGQEVSQTVESVRALDRETGCFTQLSGVDCRFAYRSSIFNSTHAGRYLITSVRFRCLPFLEPNLTYADLAPLRGTHPTPLDVYHYVRQIRDRKGMLLNPPASHSAGPHPDTRSAGSFFKNPVVAPAALAAIAASLAIAEAEIPRWPMPSGELKLAAAWLIERAGFHKGFDLGPVGISTRHTLAFVNRSGTATCADLLRLRDLIVATVYDRFAIRLEQEPVFLR